MKPRSPKPVSRERQLLGLTCRALDDKKAGDLRAIDVAGLSSITDYVVVATGLADTHLRALRIAVELVLDAHGAKIAGIDTNQHSGWLVVDAYQIMVHLFTAPARAKYALEQLWRDGREVPVAALLAPEAPAAKIAKAGKAPRRKPAARPRARRKSATE